MRKTSIEIHEVDWISCPGSNDADSEEAPQRSATAGTKFDHSASQLEYSLGGSSPKQITPQEEKQK
jgi:hypothetical protein